MLMLQIILIVTTSAVCNVSEDGESKQLLFQTDTASERSLS